MTRGFAYEAARPDGALVRGTLDAASTADAAAVLSARGLFPVRVDERAPAPPLFGAPSRRALATVFTSLASLVDAGIPLEPALRATERVATGALGRALARVRTRVREGGSLAAALAAEGATFPPVAVGLVRAGERGVGLGPALAQAAARLEREAETLARLRAALAYPALLALVGLASVALIGLVVVPRFAALLGDLGTELPPTTRLLLMGSELVRGYGFIALPIVAAAVVFAARLAARRRAAWHERLLALPLVGSIRHALASARACRALGALLGGGATALVALDVARDAAGDAAVAARLARARERIVQGAGLAAALGAAHALTPTTLQLAAIGEGSGRLARLLDRAAELDEADAERRLKTLVAIAEPVLILGFAGLVAFVAAALLQAVYAVRPM